MLKKGNLFTGSTKKIIILNDKLIICGFVKFYSLNGWIGMQDFTLFRHNCLITKNILLFF